MGNKQKLKVLGVINRWERRSFSYGTVDCCQFAGFVCKELTGKDYLSGFGYNSERAATKIIDGHGSLKETVSSVLGEPVEDFSSLQDGSPLLVKNGNDYALGVKLGSVAVCLVKKGMGRVSKKHICCGWDVSRV
jgi:hypothetical protein